METVSTDFKHILILGAGRFGKLAVKRINQSGWDTTITVIDHNPENLQIAGITPVCDDAVKKLFAMLESIRRDVDLIIPTIPVHVAAEWLKLKLKADKVQFESAPIPASYFHSLPNPIRISESQILASFADFICPASCDEPEDHCPHTGKKKVTALFDLFKTTCPADFEAVILQSHQIFPGIGGIFPNELDQLYKQTQRINCKKLLIGTACRCHGITDGIYLP